MSPLLSHAADAVFPVGSLAVMCQLQDQPSEDHTRALMARLDDFLDAGRTTVFVDMARLSVEPPGLRLALARWGVERKSRLRSLHVRVPSATSHYRMTVTRIVLGEWLVSHLHPECFLEQLSRFFGDAEEGAMTPC